MIVIWVIVGIIAVAIIILVHELGHYLAARAVGIKVQQFSIGFGPEIAGWDRGGTRYSLKWFLAGGSVRILGMNPDEEVSEEDFPHSYYGVPHWKRAIVVLAGSFAHVLLAMILFYLVYWPIGVPVPKAKVGDVTKTIETSEGKTYTSPAYAAGLKKGDYVVSVNGVRTEEWDELVGELASRPGKNVKLKIVRNGKEIEKTVSLLSVGGRGVLGIKVDMKDTIKRRSNPLKAVVYSAQTTGKLSVLLVKAFGSIFSVKTFKILIGRAERTPESPRSIVGAAQLVAQAARYGLAEFLAMLGQILIFLAIFNLMPLPPLDGGHIIVIVVEKIFKKKVDMRKLTPVAILVIAVLAVIALRLAILDITEPLPLP